MPPAVTSGGAFRPSRHLTSVIALLAATGIAVSAVSLYHHFSASKTSFCDLGQSFNCDLVNRSAYSTVRGLPVALLGIFGYLLIFALATVYRDKAESPFVLAGASLAGLSFALYLTYIEAYVLTAWCILCLSSLAIIFAVTVLSVVLAAKALRRT